MGRLYLLLGNYVSRHGLGELYFAPVDVVLGRLTLVEPDMLFIHRSRSDVITEREVIAAPDLAVEILSPSSARTDHGRKRALYQEHGVTEYWIVDCEQEQVEVWRPGAMAAVVYGGGGRTRFAGNQMLPPRPSRWTFTSCFGPRSFSRP